MTALAPPTPLVFRVAPPPSNRMHVQDSSRSVGAISEELSATTRSPARPARLKVRVALWRRQIAHHSADQRTRTHRPLAGGHRRAQGMWSEPGPGQ
eukprot:2936273-Alexandrium_andersonii.AAC.1